MWAVCKLLGEGWSASSAINRENNRRRLAEGEFTAGVFRGAFVRGDVY